MIRVFGSVAFFVLLWNPPTGANDTYWPLESIEPPGVVVWGQPVPAEGVKNQCLGFDGESLLSVKDSVSLGSGLEGFTLTAWVNPYLPNRQQQMIAAKNCYSRDERQWGVMIDRDNRFRLYVWQGRWVTVASPDPVVRAQQDD